MKHILIIVAITWCSWAHGQAVYATEAELGSIARYAFVGKVVELKSVEIDQPVDFGGSRKRKVDVVLLDIGSEELTVVGAAGYIPWFVGRKFFVLASRPESNKVRIYLDSSSNRELVPGPIAQPFWHGQGDWSGGLIEAVVIPDTEPLGYKDGERLSLFAGYAVKRFGQEPYVGVKLLTNKILWLGAQAASFDEQMVPKTVAWLRNEFSKEAMQQVSDREPEVRMAVFSLLSRLLPRGYNRKIIASWNAPNEFWRAYGDFRKMYPSESEGLKMLDSSPAGSSSDLIDHIEGASGALREELLRRLVAIRKEHVGRFINLIEGPRDATSYLILMKLALSSGMHEKLAPKEYTYQSGKPLYPDMTDLIKLWRENPPWGG